MTPLAREILQECGRRAEEGEPLSDYGRTLFRLLQMISWHLAETPSRATMPTGTSSSVVRALAVTENHLTESPRFEDFARMIGQTPRTLARRLAAETGLTWGQILQTMRIISAIEMLAETKAPFTEVALAVGYQSLSAFNAAFRSFTGRRQRLTGLGLVGLDHAIGLLLRHPVVDASIMPTGPATT